jgi:nitrite reductase (cytochrome c-552)
MQDKPKHSKLGWVILTVTATAAFALGLFATTIVERRGETIPARLQFMQPIPELEPDAAVWGRSFPRQYDSWKLTSIQRENFKYGGSGFRDYLKEDPRLVVIWAGNPFSIDYNQARGHAHSLTDVLQTRRIDQKTPGTCFACKTSDAPRLMEKMGVAEFYAANFHELKAQVSHPTGCVDCHDSETMQLRVSRPALREAYERMGKNIDKASRQELRSLVCAQCHSEYYFKGEGKYLTFPWDEGLKAEDMERYYARTGHVDWTHSISGAKMIKMQHPDYEVYSQGVHAFQGVSCADCHMPYKSEGGIKFTDHHIQSPLYNVQNSCQVCHRWSEDEIHSRVQSIQDKNHEMLSTALTAITAAHLEIGDAWRNGVPEAELQKARELVSKAQMYWDYVAAHKGMGFHAPQECARVLAKAINIAQECRLDVNTLRTRKGLGRYKLPDISTKEKAQAYIRPYVDAQRAADRAREEAAKAEVRPNG